MGIWEHHPVTDMRCTMCKAQCKVIKVHGTTIFIESRVECCSYSKREVEEQLEADIRPYMALHKVKNALTLNTTPLKPPKWQGSETTS